MIGDGERGPQKSFNKQLLLSRVGVTAELCQKQIQHCHGWMERLMQSEEGGSLHQFGSLQVLLPLAAALLKAGDPAPDTVPLNEEDKEEQDEAAWTQ